jgi:hypothetical protein
MVDTQVMNWGKWFGILMLLLVPASAFGHSEFFFPRVFSPADLQTTGLQSIYGDRPSSVAVFLRVMPSGNMAGHMKAMHTH